MVNQLTDNLIQIYGDKATAWLSKLPSMLHQLSTQYELSDLLPVSNMTYNYVATGFQNETPVVVKLGMDESALAREAACLSAYQASGAVQLFSHGVDHIVMQQASPGNTLKEYHPNRDELAVSVCCDVIKSLQIANIPTHSPFDELDTILSVLDKQSCIPISVLDQARTLRDQLLSTAKQRVLLHGDLHHDNILQHNDSWLAIDPKGFIGDPAFEPAAFLANPIPDLISHPQLEQFILKRIQCFSEYLQIDGTRIQDWLFVKSVLCWTWSIDDNIDPSYWERLVNHLLVFYEQC